MAQKIIRYLPKTTGAKTEYREITDEDSEFILRQLIEILAHMAEYDRLRDQDSVWVRDQWWHRRTAKISKGRDGPNSPCSLVGGIIHNFMFKTPPQRDLTPHQMEDLETITAVLSQIMPSVEALRFQIGLAHD